MKLLYFLKVEITVKDGQMPNFISYTERLLPIVQANTEWKLIAALSAVTGVPNTVVHIWQLPSADALLEGMDYFASDPLQNLYPPLLACCQQQKQEIYTSMPYNPLGANHAVLNMFRKSERQRNAAMPNDNLIVYVNPDPNHPQNTNGGLYSIPAAVYTNPAYAMSAETAGQALSLLSQGTVVANIPDNGIGLGGWCYLVNLPALQPPAVNPGQSVKLTASQVLTAVKAMLKHTQAAVPGTKDKEIAESVEALVAKFR